MSNNLPIYQSNTITTLTTLTTLRKELLDNFRQKQSFRVSIGKRSWVLYERFNESYNLREILNDEIVIEFDSPKKWENMTPQEKLDFYELVVRAIGESGINLRKAGITFELWDHKGKSPHLHIHNLPIGNLTPDKRALFKKMFIRKYVPLEYLPRVDLSLTGDHMIAIEWAKHWKSTLPKDDKDYQEYELKKLIHIFDEREVAS